MIKRESMTPKNILKAQRIVYLINSSLNNGLDEDELEELEKWKQVEVDHLSLYDEILSSDFQKTPMQWQPADSDKSLSNIKKRVARRRRNKIIRIASAAVLIIGMCVFLNDNLNLSNNGSSKNDIPHGRIGATLTYQNGRKIQLSGEKAGLVVAGNKLQYGDGSSVDQQKYLGDAGEFQQITTTTPAGFTFSLTLPDGSKVWLNATSSLSFPSSFSGQTTREVSLTGEAYFIINHNENQPFIVKTQKQMVEDLGTAFSINAYADEPAIKTTLFEGAVKVYEDKGRFVLLKPGEQSMVTPSGIKVVRADMEEELAWKNGYFRFNNEDIHSIMRKISRWYGVDVEFEKDISAEGLYGTISRYKNISEVLSMLEQTKNVHFEIKERRVIVKK